MASYSLKLLKRKKWESLIRKLRLNMLMVQLMKKKKDLLDERSNKKSRIDCFVGSNNDVFNWQA
jgi:putative lipase involved disintegration of autophagic bodies